MEILGYDGADRPMLGLERATRDALAAYAALMAPSGRRKWVERQFDLSVDEARAVCEGKAGPTTIEKIWKHPNGGWAVVFPVMGAVIGQDADVFIRNQRKRHAALAQRHRELGRDLRAGLDLFSLRRPELGDGLHQRGHAHPHFVGQEHNPDAAPKAVADRGGRRRAP